MDGNRRLISVLVTGPQTVVACNNLQSDLILFVFVLKSNSSFTYLTMKLFLSRFSEFSRNKILKTSWEEKMQQRIEKKTIKLKEQELKQAKSLEKEVHNFMPIHLLCFLYEYFICLDKCFHSNKQPLQLTFLSSYVYHTRYTSFFLEVVKLEFHG